MYGRHRATDGRIDVQGRVDEGGVESPPDKGRGLVRHIQSGCRGAVAPLRMDKGGVRGALAHVGHTKGKVDVKECDHKDSEAPHINLCRIADQAVRQHFGCRVAERSAPWDGEVGRAAPCGAGCSRGK